jgi:membrane protein YdbS with pleckstrin-like domain
MQAMNEETPLWKGSSSQWLNLGHYAVGGVVMAGIGVAGIFSVGLAWVALVLPIGYLLWRYLLVRTRVFELTSERIRVTSGVINQHIDEIELYRVKDTQMYRKWWMRLTGLASVQLDTSDRSTPVLIIPAVSKGMQLRELIRKQVEIIRDRKRVREIDFDEAGSEAPFDQV